MHSFGLRKCHLSVMKEIFTLNVDSGKIIWSNNLLRNFGGVRPTWGFSGSLF